MREVETGELGQKSAFVTGNICSDCRLSFFWSSGQRDIVVYFKGMWSLKKTFHILYVRGETEHICNPLTLSPPKC